MRAAAISARGQPQRNLAPRLGLPLEERLGARTVRIPAGVSAGVVAEEQGTGDERNEPADLVLNKRHGIRDPEARTERLRDLVERLFFPVCSRDVLQRVELLTLVPRRFSGRIGRSRG